MLDARSKDELSRRLASFWRNGRTTFRVSRCEAPTVPMEDLVALRATLASGETRFFLTWGRLFGSVDPRPLVEAVTPHVVRMARGEVVAVQLCDTLQEAAGEPYFFEAFFEFAQRPIPFGPNYANWVADMRERVESGKEISFLGERGPQEQEP